MATSKKTETVEETQTLTLIEKLTSIQSMMKAPKNLRNSFGNYNYRNAESILESFKPFGKQYGCVLTLTDGIELVGDRYYVVATAVLTDGKENVMTKAYARESFSKKGMDESQITGSSSSYARKYALNGLFLLDDTKDADTDEQHNEIKNRPVPKAKTNSTPITPEQVKLLGELYSSDQIGAMCAKKGVKTVQEWSSSDAATAIEFKQKKGQ